MIKAEIPGLIDGEGSAKTDTTINAKGVSPQKIKINDLEEVFVPADGNAVLCDATKTQHDALIKRFIEGPKIPDRGRGSVVIAHELWG